MYAKRLTIVALLVLSLAFVLGKIFDARYRDRWRWLVFDKMEVAMSDGPDYDILFLGNSRTHTGLNPYYIDSATGLNSYNLAIGAADEQEMKLLATVYLQHHRAPKLAVIGLDNSMLVKYNNLEERFAYLFYLRNDTVRAFMKRNGFPAGLIRYIPFLKYSFFDEYNRASVFTRGPAIPRFGHNLYKGFINVYPALSGDTLAARQDKNLFFRDSLPAPKRINDTAAAVFTQVIRELQSKGTKVILLFPPVRDRRPEMRARLQPFETFFLDLARRYQATVIRADTSDRYAGNFFIDNGHLNEPGTRVLSREVGEFINNLTGVSHNK